MWRGKLQENAAGDVPMPAALGVQTNGWLSCQFVPNGDHSPSLDERYHSDNYEGCGGTWWVSKNSCNTVCSQWYNTLHVPKVELSAWLAQLVEHLTCKHGLTGLIPVLGKCLIMARLHL